MTVKFQINLNEARRKKKQKMSLNTLFMFKHDRFLFRSKPLDITKNETK